MIFISNKGGLYIIKNGSIHQEVIIKEFPDLLCKHGPITSCQIDGETMETVMDFIFLGSKFTVDIDCGYEIKTYGAISCSLEEKL